MDIEYQTIEAENIEFKDNDFDAITAVQCFWYFKHEILLPKIKRILKPNGKLLKENKKNLPFTRETWNGRMKSCRGIGASLSETQIEKWGKEHIKLFTETTSEQFEIKHYIAIAELVKKE